MDNLDKFECLNDSINDRFIKEVVPPPVFPIDKSSLYKNEKEYNYENIKKWILREGKLSKNDIVDLIVKTTKILKEEPNVLKLKDPITIVGDIHGQYYDLLSLLDLGGNFENNQYIFLGDYVDRGSFSIEVLILLFVAKYNYPTNVWLIRGNHECRNLTSYFNFKQECEVKYDSEVYGLFMLAFDSLPLGSLINGKFVCLHGGISKLLNNDVSNILTR